MSEVGWKLGCLLEPHFISRMACDGNPLPHDEMIIGYRH